MTRVDVPVTPMWRVLAVLGTFAAGCAASVLLWNAWSPRCGEACPSRAVVHMLVFLGLLPTLGTLLAVLLVSTAWPRRVKALVGGAALAAAVVAGAVLAQVP